MSNFEEFCKIKYEDENFQICKTRVGYWICDKNQSPVILYGERLGKFNTYREAKHFLENIKANML